MNILTYPDREAWIAVCADRYMTSGGAPAEMALGFAETCADQQEEMEGPYSAEWESPADAADEDMSYWEAE